MYLHMYINIAFVKLRPHADIFFTSKFFGLQKIHLKKIELEKKPNYFIDFENE